MPSRRTLLTGAAAAGASALAGCSMLGDSLPRARQGDDPSAPDGGRVVATAEMLEEASPEGAFYQSSVAVEHRDELHLFARQQLIPGTNEYGTGWKLDGFTVEQDYPNLDPSGPVTRSGSYVQAPPEDSPETKIRMGYGDEAERATRWEVAYVPASGATWGPTFATRVPIDGSLSDGDPLATNRLTVRTTKWRVRHHEHDLATTLVYGADRRQ